MEDKDKKSVFEETPDNGNPSVAEVLAEEEALSDQVKVISPGRMVLKRFFRSKLSVIGLVTIVVLFLFAFVGPLFSGLPFIWGEMEEDATPQEEPLIAVRNSNYYEQITESDLMVMLFPANAGELASFNSFSTGEKNKWRNRLNAMFADEEAPADAAVIGSVSYKGETYRFQIVKEQGGLQSYYLLDENDEPIRNTYYKTTETYRTVNLQAAPCWEHWLGTDSKGYDVFSRLMYGGRISLTLSFLVIIIQTVLGIILGGVSGYFGKWIDQLIMRITDILNCLPSLPIMLIISAILDGTDIDDGLRIYYLMGVLSLIGWTGIARVVRGQILFLREQEFMVAAEALGLSVPRRIFKHLIPNVMPQLIVQMTLGLGSVILSESTLSYLGLGIRPPSAAWGTMISDARDPVVLQYYPNQWIPAGVLIVLAVLAFNFVGDGLRDAFDPKARR